jgi:hypothetical protein
VTALAPLLSPRRVGLALIAVREEDVVAESSIADETVAVDGDCAPAGETEASSTIRSALLVLAGSFTLRNAGFAVWISL